MAVAVYNHYKRINHLRDDDVELQRAIYCLSGHRLRKNAAGANAGQDA